MSGFSSPVAGGGGDLIRFVLKSINYAAGSLGWAIYQNGNAEFNDVTIRGDFEITGADGSYIRGVTGGTASLQEQPPTLAGTTWVPGSLFTQLFGPSNNPETVVVSPRDAAATAAAPSIHLQGPIAANDQHAVITYSNKVVFEDLGGTGLIEVNYVSGHQDGPVMVAGATWTNLSFNAGYSAFSSGYTPAYRWLGPNDIELRGVIQKGTGAGGAGANGFADGNSPCTLTAAIRPAEILNFAVGCQNRSPNFATACVRIGTDGVLSFQTGAAHDPGWIALDGIRYSLT